MADARRQVLVVVEDRHAERELRVALGQVGARGDASVVLTGDALLAMRLRREGHDARLPLDLLTPALIAERDGIAMDGVAGAFGAAAEVAGIDFGRFLQYTLIPPFMRAIRSVTSVDDELRRRPCARVVTVGTGPLVDAARRVAQRDGLRVDTSARSLVSRARQLIGRVLAGRATRWVNTDFRALVLEPGFLLMLFVKGFLRKLTKPGTPVPGHGSIIVAGDRFTADVVERMRNDRRPVVLAGATQPGRALFAGVQDLVTMEAFTRPADVLRGLSALLDALAQAFSLAGTRAHGERFAAAGVDYWPLVGRTVWLHVVAWLPLLRHLQALTLRAARACPDARVLVSADVTAYSRVLLDTARRAGLPSIGIQHGMLSEGNGHAVAHVDTLAVWGDVSEPWFRSRAPQTARFVVTGNPRFDGLAARIESRRSKPPSAPIPNPQSPIPFSVVICTGFVNDFSVAASEYENLGMIDEVLAWAAAAGGVRVIHKMHPGEEAAYYKAAGRALGWDRLNLVTIREPILHDLLEQAGVLVAAYSTTVLEAVALGTPAIVFDCAVQRRLVPLDQVPGVAVACTKAELRAHLDAAKAAGAIDRSAMQRSAALRGYVSCLDGGATERVAALLTS